MNELRRVGLNLLYLVPGETGGMETFARRLVPRIVEAAPGLELAVFVNQEASEDLGGELEGVEVIPVPVQGRSRARRVLAEQVRLPRLVQRHDIDLLHNLGSTSPLRPGCVNVVTLYDVIYARHPQAHTLAMRLGLRVLVPLAARSADRIITLSEASASDIHDVLGVPKDQIDVVYPGGKPPSPATSEVELRERHGLGDAPFVLSLSARRPHKNLQRLLEAFARLETAAAPLLVLPGYATFLDDELRREIDRLGIADRVRLLGWIPDPDLEGLYAAASCFVFPSLAEGFGLPVLEAMERGVPVACSRASSLPEVAGEAARYFDPLDVDDMRRAIEELLADCGLATRLSEAGRAQARRFSWERSARETVDVYERAWRLGCGGR